MNECDIFSGREVKTYFPGGQNPIPVESTPLHFLHFSCMARTVTAWGSLVLRVKLMVVFRLAWSRPCTDRGQTEPTSVFRATTESLSSHPVRSTLLRMAAENPSFDSRQRRPLPGSGGHGCQLWVICPGCVFIVFVLAGDGVRSKNAWKRIEKANLVVVCLYIFVC